jgi:hypothetical protein
MFGSTPHNPEVRIIAPQSHRPQRAFAQVVIDRQVALLQVTAQRRPVVQGVADRLPQHRFGQRQRALLVQPPLEFRQHRRRTLLP